MTQLAVGRSQSAQERHWLRRGGNAAAHCQEHCLRPLRRQMDDIAGARLRQLGRLRIEIQRALAPLAIETGIRQDSCVRPAGVIDATVLAAMQAAHLEKVGKIAIEHDGELQIDRIVAVIADREPLMGGVVPEKNGAHEMQGVLGQDKPLVEIDIGLVRSTVSWLLSSRTFEPSSNGCTPLSKSSRRERKRVSQ